MCILRYVFFSANGDSFKRLLKSYVTTDHQLKCTCLMCGLNQVSWSHYFCEAAVFPSPILLSPPPPSLSQVPHSECSTVRIDLQAVNIHPVAISIFNMSDKGPGLL